jgi:hypothetical protein
MPPRKAQAAKDKAAKDAAARAAAAKAAAAKAAAEKAKQQGKGGTGLKDIKLDGKDTVRPGARQTKPG